MNTPFLQLQIATKSSYDYMQHHELEREKRER